MKYAPKKVFVLDNGSYTELSYTDKLNMEIIVTFPGMAAQQESEFISGNMRWSYKKRMESGEFNCCSPAYGYILKDGQLMINEPQAAVIRRIFDLYLSGVGKQSIANILNDEGMSRRYGQMKWYYATVDYILNNERYMGDALLQKSYTTETLPFRNKGELPKYYVENSNPPIVSREIYQAVQTLQNSRKNVYSNSKGKYLLSKVMRCPDCGMTFRRQVVKGTAYWLCSNKAAGMTECRPLRLRETAVYETFTMLVQKLADNRKTLFGDLIRQKNTQKHIDRKSNIFNLGVPILCPKCGSKMCRRHDRNRKCQDWWLCQNDNCKNIILIQEQKSIINENSGVLEECFADAIAYAIIFNYIQVEFNNEINKKLLAGQALFLEIMNLQLLAMQHMTVSEESFESSVSIRLGFFRNYVGLYFEQVEKSFEEMIQSTVVRYENRITNLMIECFNELEKRADNIYDGLIDTDGLINMSKILGLSDTYNNDLI